jgi:hypothetical protein
MHAFIYEKGIKMKQKIITGSLFLLIILNTMISSASLSVAVSGSMPQDERLLQAAQDGDGREVARLLQAGANI